MKVDLLKQLQEAHNRLLKTTELLPNEGTVVGEWSKKEILSHIAGWYEEGVDATPKILSGEKPNSFRYSINGFNKLSVEKRRKLTLEEITQEVKKLHQKFIMLVSKLGGKQITSFNGTMLGKKPINVLWIINEEISHDNNHAKEIEDNYGN